MKKMNYQKAALTALRKFEWARGLFVSIEDGAQFRKLTVYESAGHDGSLTYVLFGLEFCDAEGSNYREVFIRVRCSEQFGIDAEIDLSSLKEIK